MRKIASLLFALTFILISCTGEDGRDGAIIASSSYEKVIDFSSSNNYEDFEPYGFEVSPSDVTLVYILWETDNGQDIWRLVPQIVEFTDGNLVYNYDFTQSDVRIFLDGTTDFTLLDNSFTQNQIFRVVVVPADNLGRATNDTVLDFNDLDSVIEYYNITDFPSR